VDRARSSQINSSRLIRGSAQIKAGSGKRGIDEKIRKIVKPFRLRLRVRRDQMPLKNLQSILLGREASRARFGSKDRRLFVGKLDRQIHAVSLQINPVFAVGGLA